MKRLCALAAAAVALLGGAWYYRRWMRRPAIFRLA